MAAVQRVARTPEERFDNLDGYDFKPNYVNVPSQNPDIEQPLRIHYIDEGPEDAEFTILLLHGQPSWSYLYRKMIKLLRNDFRVIAPDLIGFGKSDKPTNVEDYTYERQVTWMADFIDILDLENMTCFLQDWGGLIGLRLVAEMPEKFSGLCLGNTALPVGRKDKTESKAAKMQKMWRNFTLTDKSFRPEATLQQYTGSALSDSVLRGYAAPFPEENNEFYMAGTRIMPSRVPLSTTDPSAAENRQALKKLAKFNKPVITCYGSLETMMKAGVVDVFFQKFIPGCKGMPHRVIEGAHHFLQEDKPEECAQALRDCIIQQQQKQRRTRTSKL